MKNGPGDPVWGWNQLMKDIYSKSQEPQPEVQKPNEQKQGTFVNNVYNYGTGQKFKFSNVLTIAVTVIVLTIVGLLLWKSGAIEYIIDILRSLIA